MHDERLAAKVWNELTVWSGWGLSALGISYLGSADIWLGLAAATMGRQRTAVELLTAGAAQDDRRGAGAWSDRAKELLLDVTGSSFVPARVIDRG